MMKKVIKQTDIAIYWLEKNKSLLLNLSLTRGTLYSKVYGKASGTNKKVVILNMYADGVSMENIIKWADADENLVKAVIAEYKESRA